MWITNQPYTTFRAVNAKDGKIRLQGGGTGTNGIVLTKPTQITAERTVQFNDVPGTIVLRGTSSDVNWGTFALGAYPIAGQNTISTFVVVSGVQAGYSYIAQGQGGSVTITGAYGAGANSLGLLIYNGSASITAPAQTITWTQLS